MITMVPDTCHDDSDSKISLHHNEWAEEAPIFLVEGIY